MANNNFADWLQVQLVAVNIYLKLCNKPKNDDYVDSVEYHLGYRDAIKRAMKYYKSVKEVE